MGDMPPPPAPGAFARPASRPCASIPPSERADHAVMLTNDEASTSKLACVERGYLRDDFVHRFARRGRKYSPLINRGYYARVLAMRRVLDAFLAVSLTNDPADASKRARRQIVSLGAGFDTTWFRLRAEGREPARYIEVDHAPVVAKNVAIVNEADDMRALCVGGAGLAPLERLAEPKSTARDEPPSASADVAFGDAGGYRVVAADLRDVPSLDAAVRAAGFDPTLPTLVFSECCLAYLPDDDAAAVIRWAAEACSSSPASAYALYDPMRPDDAFGRQMLLNLEARGCPLLGIRGGADPETHAARFRASGWTRAGCVDMNDAHAAAAREDPEGTRRAERAEMLDELEELRLMQAHYCVAWGTSGTRPDADAVHEAVSALWR